MKLPAEKTRGLVVLREGYWGIDGVFKNAVLGLIEHFTREQLEIPEGKSGESWGVAVYNSDKQLRQIIPGCQIKLVQFFDSFPTTIATACEDLRNG